ncbi:MAG: histidinol dehydrogenase [Longimicrobiales bacterium]
MMRCPFIAVRGEIGALSPEVERTLLARGEGSSVELAGRVADVIADVRLEGDAALVRFALAFDGVALDRFEISTPECRKAFAALTPAVRDALVFAYHAIADFHRAQLPRKQQFSPRPGVRLERRPEPLRSVGVYAPGGKAAYPSSVLMGAVPARVAGVDQVVVCSPPGPDGKPLPAVLAACHLARADRVFALGGAGAVAALALGTASVPRVDNIVGPGNAYVAEAKRQLNGVVAIDCPAGPSEVLVIADETADPRLVAAELLAQAEHDADAAAVLVSTDAKLLGAVHDALATLLRGQPRRAIIEAALAARGALLLARDLDEALAFAECYAPEHLLLVTRSPRTLAERVRAAGTIFIGAGSSVAFGDYVTGANHVLPTAGLARSWSGLSTADFVRWTTVQEIDGDAARMLAGPTATLADAEGLPAHALAARLRLEGEAVARFDAAPLPLRQAYAAIHLYDPKRVPCAIDLSDNTNLFGVSPSVASVLASPPTALITRYPSVYAGELKRALAEHFAVDLANITTGCGSDDVIDSAIRAFCEPRDTVAYPAPTFGVVPLFARMNAALPIEVPLAANFALDADAVLATAAPLTYICRPNNPTGTQFDRAAVERIARETRGVVLIDEAYADFADDDFIAFAVSSSRAVVLRTLSKAWGMAGLRIGFAIGPEPLIREIEKSRGPYKVNAAAEAAAVAALHHDADWVGANIAAVRENRARLSAALSALGLQPLVSATNFVLVPLPPVLGVGQALVAKLRESGIAVRGFPDLPRIGDCIRITIGPWPMLQSFLDALTCLLDVARTGAQPSTRDLILP